MERLATDQALRETLKTSGLKRVGQSRWEDTARATLAAYRSTIRRPSERSLQMRRLLRDAVIHWAANPAFAESVETAGPTEAISLDVPVGIRNALQALNFALSARLKRELRRLPVTAHAGNVTRRFTKATRDKSLSLHK